MNKNPAKASQYKSLASHARRGNNHVGSGNVNGGKSARHSTRGNSCILSSSRRAKTY